MPDRVHLDFVAVHFSTRCESKCSFGYAHEAIHSKIQPTSLPDIARILQKLASEEVSDVLFVGGDPVVHPDFHESLICAKSLGLRTHVLSNSWSIKPLSMFAETVSYIDHCEATVLGSTPAKHDAITQRPGSHARLFGNLVRVAAQGKKVGICLNAMPSNLHDVFDIVRSFVDDHRIPASGLMIQRIIPSGAATGEFRFGLNLGDVDTLMRQIDRVAQQYSLPIYFEDPVPWCTVKPEYHKYLAKCQWGFTRGALNSVGQLNRCGADDHYRLGSIWEGSIQDKWLSNPTLVSFRSKKYLPDECQSCDLLDNCGGGCPLSCGTLRDHDVDQLYIQKMQSIHTGKYEPNAPSGRGYSRATVRYAYAGDLEKIVAMERAIFGDVSVLFRSADIQRLFQRCPKAFRVVVSDDNLLGYSVIFPITASGVETINSLKCQTIARLPSHDLSDSFGNGTAALFVEVLASPSSAPQIARIALLRDAITTVCSSRLPAYTLPISPRGYELARRLEFSPLNDGRESIYMRMPEPGGH